MDNNNNNNTEANKFKRSQGGDKCFICNKTDHISNQCPKKRGDGKNCFYCNKPGHTVMKCPEKQLARSNKKFKKTGEKSKSFDEAHAAKSGVPMRGDRGGDRGGRGGSRGGRVFQDRSNNNNKRKSADDLEDDLVSFNDDGENVQPLKRRRGDNNNNSNDSGDSELVASKAESAFGDDDELKIIGEDNNNKKDFKKKPKEKNFGDLKSSISTHVAESQAMHLTKRLKDELKQTDLEAKVYKPEYFIQANKDVNELPDLLRQLHPLLHDLPNKKLKSGSPLVTIVTSSATRAIGISKVLSDFNVKSKVGLYFSKHKKIEEHIEMLKRYPVRVIVGTPSRLLKLAEDNHLKLDGSTLVYEKDADESEQTRWILIDSSFRTKNGLDIWKTVPQELSDFIQLNIARLDSGKMKLMLI